MSAYMLMWAAVAVLGQNGPVISLQSGDLQIALLSEAERSSAIAAAAGNRYDPHVLTVLTPGMTAGGRQLLARSGLRTLNSLGGDAWIASIDSQAADHAADLAQSVQWLVPMAPQWKLHPFLAAGGVPEWTTDTSATDAIAAGQPFNVEQLLREVATHGDPLVVVYVLAHKDESLNALAADIPVLTGGRVLSTLHTVHGLVVGTPNSAIVPLADDPRIRWIEPALPPLSDKNDQNREVTQSDEVQEFPYGLTGQGVSVMVYDGGDAYAPHADFGGRLTVRDSAGTSDHATHVSGTIGGDGTASNGQYRGMAPGVTIQSYGFEQEGGLAEGFLYTDPGDLEADYGQAINSYGAVIANNSIGTNTAPNGFPCEWTGNYGVTSSVIDSVVRGNLGGSIRIMWANGNERGSSNCGTSFFSTAPPACAKNHITVGALNSNDESVTSFTSWGPADDGRIKPDISTAGCQSGGDGGVTSCSSSGGYSSKCGTSMASPTACGIGALIIEDWRSQYPGKDDLMNSTLKALLAHTAADLGNTGPDLKYGYGSLRARGAIDHLRTGSLLEAAVDNGGSYEFLVIVHPGDDQFQVTLAWDDEPAEPLVIPSLVNDLDLVVIDPTGTRRYPWAIDPANPGDPATQGAEDHLNNIEQVTVQAPQAGLWRVQVQGTSVPIGPQSFGVMATPDLVACSSTGIITLDRAAYPLEGVITVTVVDCDLNTDDGVVDSVDVLVTSTDEPDGEWITLMEEDPAASTFTGSLPHSTTDAPGTILVSNGGTVEAVYIDAQDADGNTNIQVLASAAVDGDAPELIHQEATAIAPRVINFVAELNEPCGMIVRWGTSCDDLTGSIGPVSATQDHSIDVAGFDDNTTYYYTLEFLDHVGNSATYDNKGACWMVTTPDIPDFFTEQFASGIDLDGMSIRCDVIGGVDGYTACAEPITALPVDPAGSTSISLSDDDSEAITPASPVMLYGESYSTIYVGSNGVLTFNGGDTDYTESLSEHFSSPRISALWDDLNPSAGGTVSWKNTSDGVAITWQNVPEYSTSNNNTFQVVMHWDGTIHMSWLGLDLSDAIVGLSAGNGQDSDFEPSDLSESTSGCGTGIPGDIDGDGMVGTNDLLAVIAAWGPCPPIADCPEDLNGDGVVGADDILFIIGHWGSTGTPRGMGDQDASEDDALENSDDHLADRIFINVARLAPAEYDGVFRVTGDYLQRPWAILEMEVAGGRPVIDYDLLVIAGEATLDGQLVILVPEGLTLMAGQYTLVLAETVTGHFQDIVVEGIEGSYEVCEHPQGVSLIIGLMSSTASEPIQSRDVLDLLSKIGQMDRQWDLDGDGEVSLMDLQVLLTGLGECSR